MPRRTEAGHWQGRRHRAGRGKETSRQPLDGPRLGSETGKRSLTELEDLTPLRFRTQKPCVPAPAEHYKLVSSGRKAQHGGAKPGPHAETQWARRECLSPGDHSTS